MDITSYEKHPMQTTFYESVSISNLVFDDNYVKLLNAPDLGDILLTDSMRDSLCRFVGLSPSLNRGLYSTDKDLWYKVLNKLYQYHHKEEVILLLSKNSVDNCSYSVKGICNNSSRESITTKCFIDKVLSYFETYPEIEISDIEFSNLDTKSSVILLSKEEYLFKDKKFRIGVAVFNDETSNSYTRMVIKYTDSDYYYLPSKIYNLSSSRYDKTTSSSMESLEILLLRVVEDMTSSILSEKIDYIIDRMYNSYESKLSYNEFNRALVLIRNVYTASDVDGDIINDIVSLFDKFDTFETTYGQKNHDYLWQCTAFSDYSVGDILEVLDSLYKEYTLYPENVIFLRELLGEYLISPRVCETIAVKRC